MPRDRMPAPSTTSSGGSVTATSGHSSKMRSSGETRAAASSRSVLLMPETGGVNVGGADVVLVAARDEEQRIGATVAALLEQFPAAEILVPADGSRDDTAARAEGAGARVIRLPRRGKGQALTAAEREAPPGRLLLADADLSGDLR